MANTVYTRKDLGRPLTFGELDANFSVLNGLATDGIISVSSAIDYAVIVSTHQEHFYQQDNNGVTTGTTIQYDFIEMGTDGITLNQDDNGNYTQITVENDGVYEIVNQFNGLLTGSVQLTGAVWLMVNGSPVSGSTQFLGSPPPKNNLPLSFIQSYIIQLNAGDYVSIFAITNTGFSVIPVSINSQGNNPQGNSITTSIRKINSSDVITGAYTERPIYSTGLTKNTYNVSTDDSFKSLLINSPFIDGLGDGSPIYVNIPSSDFSIGTKIKITNLDNSGSQVILTGDSSQVVFTSLDGFYNGIPTFLPVQFLSCELTYLGIVTFDSGDGPSNHYSWYVERIGNVFTDFLEPNFVPVASNYQDFGYNDAQGSSGSSGQSGSASTTETFQQLVSSGIKSNNFYTAIADNSGLGNIMAVFATANSWGQFPGISVQIGAINSGNHTRIIIDDDAELIDLSQSGTRVGKFISVIPDESTFQYDGSSGTWTPSINLKTVIFDMNNYNGQVNSYAIEFDDSGNNGFFSDGQEISIRIINPAVNAFTIYVTTYSGLVTFEGQTSLSLDGHRAFSINGTVVSGTMIGVNMVYVAANNNFVILSYV